MAGIRLNRMDDLDIMVSPMTPEQRKDLIAETTRKRDEILADMEQRRLERHQTGQSADELIMLLRQQQQQPLVYKTHHEAPAVAAAPASSMISKEAFESTLLALVDVMGKRLDAMQSEIDELRDNQLQRDLGNATNITRLKASK